MIPLNLRNELWRQILCDPLCDPLCKPFKMRVCRVTAQADCGVGVLGTLVAGHGQILMVYYQRGNGGSKRHTWATEQVVSLGPADQYLSLRWF